MARPASTEPPQPPPSRQLVEAIGQVIRFIGQAPAELTQVLEEIARRAVEVSGAEWGYIFLRDGDVFRLGGAHGGTPDQRAYELAHPTTIGRGSIVGRVALEDAVVQIRDIREDPDYTWPAREFGGFRTLLGVPIRGEGGLIGAFGLARNEVVEFTAEEIDLVSLFADQAGVAIQLARHVAEEHEAAQREAAVRDVLQEIARSSFDLDEVLQIVTDRAVRLCHADIGNVARRDGDVFRIVAFTGFDGSSEYERIERSLAYRPERGSATGRALMDRQVVHIPDVLDDPEYAMLSLQKVADFRTLLAVPMLREGEPIGVISVGRRKVRPYSDTEIRLLQTFAEQAAIAVRVASLLAEMRQALQSERAVGQVLQTIGRSSFDLDRVLKTVIESAVELSRADFGNILRLDESSGFYQVVAYHGEVDPAYWQLVTHTPYKPDRGTLIGRTLAELRPVHIVDILEDPEYRFWEAQRTGGFRTILGVPMLRDGFPIGVFVVWRREVKPFNEREIGLLTTFADQAALAIENVRLFQTVERQRTELARFAPQVASLLSSDEGEQLLAGHRREISALFCDLRGFTSFAEMAEPEEVLGVLREYHAAVGELAVGRGGTVEHFAGDGLMVFFNDPAPVPDHAFAAVETALAMRDRFEGLAAGWRKRGYELGLGIGLALGFATLGRIGFEGRYDYGGVGNVVILASRLSEAAAGGELLVTQRMHAALEDRIDAEPVEALTLKGLSRPVTVYRVRGLRAPAA
jgi:GAF domain-containing protein